MKNQTLVHKPLPQNPDIWVSVPNYKEPILPVTGGFGWYGLQSYDFQGDKLMCHECGGFYDFLSHHIKTHKMNSNGYKNKYGLLRRSKLVSESLSSKRRDNAIRHDTAKKYLIKGEKGKSLNTRGKTGISNALEFQNKHDSCPAQSLRWLSDLAKIHEGNITQTQVNSVKPGLVDILVRRFGSFNKAKQLVKLGTNIAMSKGDTLFDKRLILEDMISFCRRYNHYPKANDYRNGLMICSFRPIEKNGGLKALILEAQQLKDEQDKRASVDINAIANKIEMECAGRARR